MTEKFEKALEVLAEALKESDELKAYNEAKKAYDDDKRLTALINEYNVQASILEMEGKKPEAERDNALIDSISERIRAIYDGISESEVLANMQSAESDLTALISAVNDKIHFTIDPDAANCTHDCSTCGGCH